MKNPRPVTVKDIYRVDRSAVERQLGHTIRTLAPWPDKKVGSATIAANAKRAAPTHRSAAQKSSSSDEKGSR
jgi:hypothetical protein